MHQRFLFLHIPTLFPRNFMSNSCLSAKIFYMDNLLACSRCFLDLYPADTDQLLPIFLPADCKSCYYSGHLFQNDICINTCSPGSLQSFLLLHSLQNRTDVCLNSMRATFKRTDCCSCKIFSVIFVLIALRIHAHPYPFPYIPFLHVHPWLLQMSVTGIGNSLLRSIGLFLLSN